MAHINYAPETEDHQINLKKLFKALWGGKVIIITLSILFGAIGVCISFLIPNSYTSSTLLAPVFDSGMPRSGDLSNIANLAGLSGILVNDEMKTTELALETLTARFFIINFISNHDIKDELFAVESYDRDTGALIYDDNIYAKEVGTWRSDTDGSSLEPTDLQAYERFLKLLSINRNKKNNLIEIEFEFVSPELARDWLQWIVDDLNKHFQIQAIEDSKKNIEHLQDKISETSVVDLRMVFTRLIENEIQQRMLAETREEFVFEVVDPPFEPEEKSSPNRALFLMLGIVAGAAFSVFFIIVRMEPVAATKER